MSEDINLTSAASFRSTVLSGAFFTSAGVAVKASLQIITIVVLARLLAPEDFGVVGMVFPIIALATVFQEAGLGMAVLQRSSVSSEEQSTLFWMNAAVGTVLGAILVILAPAAALFYNEPRVAALTAASGALVLFGALSQTQHLALLMRNMQYRELALIDGLSLVVGAVLAIGSAYIFESYWAIFLLSFGTTAGTCILSWAFSGWRPGRCAPMRQVRDMLWFGGNMTLSKLAVYLGSNIDKVLIGRVWGAAALGYYERAYKVVLLPILFVHMPLFRLVVPMLMQSREDPVRYRRIFLLSFQIALLTTVPGVAMLSAAADIMVVLVLGRQWIEGAQIFAWLAAACLAQLPTGQLSSLFISQSRARDDMVANVASSLYATAAFMAGLPWGAVGVAAAFAISQVIRMPVMIWYATRIGPVTFADANRFMLPFVVATPVCFYLALRLREQLGGVESPLGFIALAGPAVYAAALPCLLVNQAGRECLSELLRLFRPGPHLAKQLQSRSDGEL